MASHNESIGNISASCLRRPNDLHHLPPLEAEVPGNRVPTLDPHQLVVLQLVPQQQLLLLLLRHHYVLWHQLVLRNVDQQLGLEKLFENVLGGHVNQGLLGAWGHAHLHHDHCPGNILLLHPGAVGLDGLDPNLGVIREEHKHLVGRVIVVGHQNNQVASERGILSK